jgi:hypothetical protein
MCCREKTNAKGLHMSHSLLEKLNHTTKPKTNTPFNTLGAE